MSETVSIKDVAAVRSGYTFRKTTSIPVNGDLLGLQIGDIRHSRVVDPSRLSAIELPDEGHPPMLERGDVVLAAKGSHNYAAVFHDAHRQVVPSNQFLVLSVLDTASVSPAFLCWLLNYKGTQQRLARYQAGSRMASINKKAFLDFAIPLPLPVTQDKILRLNRLGEEERRLTETLMANRETMLQGMIQQLLDGAVQ